MLCNLTNRSPDVETVDTSPQPLFLVTCSPSSCPFFSCLFFFFFNLFPPPKNPSVAMTPLTPEPVDRLPMLLIANLHDIRCNFLSGSPSRLPSITTKQTVAMDFIYAEETVCWIDVGETPATTHLKCANIPDLKNVANIRTINISLSLHREWPAQFSFSPLSENTLVLRRRLTHRNPSLCRPRLNGCCFFFLSKCPKVSSWAAFLIASNSGCNFYFPSLTKRPEEATVSLPAAKNISVDVTLATVFSLSATERLLKNLAVGSATCSSCCTFTVAPFSGLAVS